MVQGIAHLTAAFTRYLDSSKGEEYCERRSVRVRCGSSTEDVVVQSVDRSDFEWERCAEGPLKAVEWDARGSPGQR